MALIIDEQMVLLPLIRPVGPPSPTRGEGLFEVQWLFIQCLKPQGLPHGNLQIGVFPYTKLYLITLGFVLITQVLFNLADVFKAGLLPLWEKVAQRAG